MRANGGGMRRKARPAQIDFIGFPNNSDGAGHTTTDLPHPLIIGSNHRPVIGTMSCPNEAPEEQISRAIPKGWQPRNDEERETYAKRGTRRMMGGAKLEDMGEIILEDAKGATYTTHGMRRK